MIKQTTVKLVRLDGKIEDLVLRYSNQSPWLIESPFDSARMYEGSDLFECLRSLRRELEKVGSRIICNGARIDCHPSRMSREMGGARNVYILRKGRQAAPDDVVDLFGDAPADRVGTVVEQETYYREWTASLR